MVIIPAVFPMLNGMLMVIPIFYLIYSLNGSAFFNNDVEDILNTNYIFGYGVLFPPGSIFKGKCSSFNAYKLMNYIFDISNLQQFKYKDTEFECLSLPTLESTQRLISYLSNAKLSIIHAAKCQRQRTHCAVRLKSCFREKKKFYFSKRRNFFLFFFNHIYLKNAKTGIKIRAVLLKKLILRKTEQISVVLLV